MKKIFCIIITVLVCLSAMSVSASEDIPESTVGAISYDGMMFNPDTGTIVRGKSGDVVIPESINGVKVTRIGVAAFANHNVKSLYIPDSVTSIGDNAFSGGTYRSVEGGKNVSAVGGMAFNDSDWTNDTQGHLIVGTVYIGYNGSEDVVTIPEGVTAFSAWMDGNFKETVKKVILPTTLKEVSYCAFRGCEALEEVVFNGPVEKICDAAFEGCSSLKNITLPYGVTSIGEAAFQRCESLQSITIPNTVKTIGSNAFSGCYDFTTITLPPSVEVVGSNAFNTTSRLMKTIYVYGAETVFEDATTGSKKYGNTDKQFYCVRGSSAEAYATHRTFSIIYIDESDYHADENDNSTKTSFDSKVSPWAIEEIEEAYDNHLVPESIVGFDLTKRVSRSEFAAIAVQLYTELSGDDEHFYGKFPFDDINSDINKDAILDAYFFGFTLGMGEGKFEPSIHITREQLATMLCRVIKKYSFEDWTIDKDSEYYMNVDGAKLFADDADISDYAKNSVYYLALHGIIKGIDDTHFAPKNTSSQQEASGYATATREQALLLSLRIYKLSDLWR